MIVDLTNPALEVVDHGASVIVHVRGGRLLVSTPTEAFELAAALKQAGWHCEEAVRLRGSRKDRVAAVETNTAFAETNKEWPNGTLPQAFTRTPAVSETRTVTFDDCPCSRTFTCDEHADGAA